MFFKLNIRQRLVFSTFILVVVIGVSTYFYAEYEVKTTLTQQIEAKLSTSSYYFMHSLDVFMYERMKDIKEYAYEGSLSTSTENSDLINKHLKERVEENKAYDNLYIFDDQFQCIAGTSALTEKEKTQFESLFYKTKFEQTVTDYIFDTKHSIEKISISFRFNRHGKQVFLVGTIPINSICQVIKDDLQYLNFEEHFDIELIDQNGYIIFSNTDDTSEARHELSSTKLKKIINLIYNPKNSFAKEFFEDSTKVCFISGEKGCYEFKGNGWFLVLSIPRKEAYLPLKQLNRSIITVFSIILLLACLAVLLVSKYFTNPLTKLTQLAEAYGEGNFGYRQSFKNEDEFGQLGRQMISMADQLQLRMEQKTELNTLLQANLEELRDQKIKIEQNKEHIESSIRYAKKIQTALLPGKRRIQKLEYKVEVLYQPYHEVSGDYFFTHEFSKDGKSYFAATVVDCTGHGVPGAFMTFIAHHLLVYLISIKKLIDPAQILEELDSGLKNTLEVDFGQTLHDGMELSMIIIDKEHRELFFAGAKRPLIIKTENQVVELTGTKRAIGDDHLMSKRVFEAHSLYLDRGDQLIMFSDGITDQFGGKNHKKIGKKRLRSWIKNTPSKSLQKELTAKIKDWKGTESQIDDMTLMTITV